MPTLKILDIDLDFFLDKRHNGKVKYVRRLNKNYQPWEANQVEKFLEKNCGLSKSSKISGKFFIHHDEVFYFWRSIQEQQGFSLNFSVDHVDAHADLGTGDASYSYIASTILTKPLRERAYPKKNGLLGLGAGNYLSFAIACRWIKNLNYITNVQWGDDSQWFNFKNFETSTGIIQLKKFSPAAMKDIISYGDIRNAARKSTPLSYEPEVPYQFIDFNTFKCKSSYDYIFLTKSPGFTPRKSDELIPIIQQYITME